MRRGRGGRQLHAEDFRNIVRFLIEDYPQGITIHELGELFREHGYPFHSAWMVMNLTKQGEKFIISSGRVWLAGK